MLTKADKIKPDELDEVEAAVIEGLGKHPAAFPQVIATSSETGAGIPELRAAIATILAERS